MYSFLNHYVLRNSLSISFTHSFSQHLLSIFQAQELTANRPDKVPVLEELTFWGQR